MLDNGYIDTAIPGVSSLSFPRGLVNFASNFRVSSETENEVILTNLTSPLDRPERFRLAYSVIKDVYTNTDIHESVKSASTRGVSVLCQLTSTASDTNAANTDYRVDLPISSHIVLKFPASAIITAELIQTHIGRLVSGLYATGDVSVARLNALMRGALVPSDI